jgi:hypothetical protein
MEQSVYGVDLAAVVVAVVPLPGILKPPVRAPLKETLLLWHAVGADNRPPLG